MTKAYIHAITPRSTVNGPGARSVVHFQGCALACPGCFNPETHKMEAGRHMEIDEIIAEFAQDADGATISGGEPFLQQEALLALTAELKRREIPIVVFSGFYLSEIEKTKLGKEILKNIDALIDGRFDEEKMAENGLRGSQNQTVHLFTERYSREDFEKRDVEIWLDAEGNVQITGFPSQDMLSALK